MLAAISALCISALGCASASQPPASSAASASETDKPAPPPESSAEAAADAGKTEAAPEPVASATPAAPSEQGDGLRKASRPPLELLTGNNVVYVFNFASSAIGTSAKVRCESEASDPGAARECVAKARGKIPVESVRFVKDAHNQYWWVTFNRYKGTLLKWHKVQFSPGKQDADTVSLNLVGKDKGIAPMARVPAALKIELPNDYSIIISDPEHGAMLYDAKIGLMDPE
jgi:hypothetical protein